MECDILIANFTNWIDFHSFWTHCRISYFRLLYAHPFIGLLVAKRINFRLFSQTLKALLNGRLTEKLHKKTLKDNTCNNQTRLRSAGDNDRSSDAVLCVKFHVRDSQNTRDQISSDRRFKRAWSNCVMYIPYILSGSPNQCWLHTRDACVITTWRLGLRAPLVARNYIHVRCSRFLTILLF